MRRSGERVSLKEVAEAAKVSIVTVSAALNGGGRVSDTRRAEIRAIAAEMGYQPNAAARLLKSKKISDLGLLIFERAEMIRENAVFMDINVQFMKECVRNGISSQQEWFDSYHHPDRIPQLLTNGMVGGLLIAGAPSGAAAEFVANQLQLPYVLLNEPGEYSVRFDSAEQIRQALYYLVSLGHRKVGIINGVPGITVFNEVGQAFRETAGALDINASGTFWIDNPPYDNFEFELNRMVDAYLAVPEATRPTALLINSGLTTKAFICELERRGVHVPADVSLVCFETVDWEVEKFSPSITAIEYNFENLIISAVAMLRSLMDNRPVSNKAIRLTPAFTRRHTVTVPSDNHKHQTV